METKRVWVMLGVLLVCWWMVGSSVAMAGEPSGGVVARSGGSARSGVASPRDASPRKARRRARRGKRWSPVQATVAVGMSKPTGEDEREPIEGLAQEGAGSEEPPGVVVTGFGGVALGGYRPGNFVVLGLRGETGGCGRGCRATALGPALRLGTVTGSSRRSLPDREIFAEGAVLLTMEGGQGVEDEATVRLGMGATWPRLTGSHLRALKNPRGAGDVARIFLLPFNHLELVAWWGAQEPGPPRVGVVVGGGL